MGCATPHDYELVAVIAATDASYPGADAMQAEANSACASGFRGYVGSDPMTSSLSLDYTYPTSSDWNAGRRDVVCYASDYNRAKLTGTVKGTER